MKKKTNNNNKRKKFEISKYVMFKVLINLYI